MSTTWILVANASQATIYSRLNHGNQLDVVKELRHDESRQKGSDLASDRSGSYQSQATALLSQVTQPCKKLLNHSALLNSELFPLGQNILLGIKADMTENLVSIFVKKQLCWN